MTKKRRTRCSHCKELHPSEEMIKDDDKRICPACAVEYLDKEIRKLNHVFCHVKRLSHEFIAARNQCLGRHKTLVDRVGNANIFLGVANSSNVFSIVRDIKPNW